MIERVEYALLNIRPYLEKDGGDIRVVDITDDDWVVVELLGACGTCPMSYMTVKNGVEETVKKSIPEIQGVRVVETSDVAEQHLT